jgi:hypothetical protein
MLIPLHSFATQGGLLSTGGFDIAHELEHLDGTSHHHNDDGSIHYDESGESDQHLAEHSASSPAATLPSLSSLQITPDLLTVIRSEFGQYIPDPVPERPQRPPQVLG